MAPKLCITDKDSFVLGYLEARSGLHTTYGVITRVSEKSIWTKRADGTERLVRGGFDRMPSLPFYRLKKEDRLAAGIAPKDKGAST